MGVPSLLPKEAYILRFMDRDDNDFIDIRISALRLQDARMYLVSEDNQARAVPASGQVRGRISLGNTT